MLKYLYKLLCVKDNLENIYKGFWKFHISSFSMFRYVSCPFFIESTSE